VVELRTLLDRHAGALDPTHPVRKKKCQKKQDGQTNPQGECAHHIAGLATVADQKHHGGRKAADDEQECDDEDPLQNALQRENGQADAGRIGNSIWG